MTLVAPEIEDAELGKIIAEPWRFLALVEMPDERTGEVFRFHMSRHEGPGWQDHNPVAGTGWNWQRDYLDYILEHKRTSTLKARQLGVTWVWAAFQLWKGVASQPGSVHLVYRQKEDDAKKIIGRMWDMLQSPLVDVFIKAVKARVITPGRPGVRPSNRIEIEFPNGRVSRWTGMASTESAGHGDVVSSALLDEYSRIDAASGIMKAVNSACGREGHIGIVSTANGISDLETGEGNYFHFVHVSEDSGFHKIFLPWSKHDERDQHWFDTDPEVRALRPHERAEQYPENEHEAFTLTNQVFFDIEALQEYARERVTEPLYRVNFSKYSPNQARLAKLDTGLTRILVEPDPDHDYAIAADVATGRGKDYSAAYVIDLGTMELCAEFHGRIDADLYAYQLHYLGRHYNTARIAVEMGGGFGETVVVLLRDGKDGRPPYPKLFRYREDDRPDIPTRQSYGFPMTMKTRPLVVDGAAQAIRERAIPQVTSGLLHEMQVFVRHDTNPSPRAQEGMNDDRVMAFAIAVEMYRRFGHHPDKPKRKPKRQPKRYPWE